MNRKKDINFICAAVFTFGIFMLGTFHNQSSAFATKKPKKINIAVIGDFSGPYAPVVGQTKPGTLDAWHYINKELGGVYGVKVNPIIKDMSGKISVGLSHYNEVINIKPKPTFIDIFITPLSEALRTRYVEDDVVGFHAGAVVSLYPQANSYGLYCMYPEQLAVAIKWFKDNWKKKGNPRMGIITWDTSYGRAILTDEFFAYAKKIGVNIVDTQLFGIRDVEVTTQLLKLRSKKVDCLITNNGGSGTMAIKKGLREMGWKVPLLNGAGGDWGTVRLNPTLFDDYYVVIHTKGFDQTKDPSIKTIMKYFHKNKRTTNDKSIFYIIAWHNALLEHKVLKETVKKYGWKGLNTKNIKKVINKIRNFSPLKGLTNITYTDKRRTPQVARIYKAKNGKLIPVTGFLKVPDMRPAKYR